MTVVTMFIVSDMCEDEDVVLAGSQLHDHLVECGFGDEGHLETVQPGGGKVNGVKGVHSHDLPDGAVSLSSDKEKR